MSDFDEYINSSLPSEKLDDDRGHIIASHLLTGLFRQDRIKQIRQNIKSLDAGLPLIGDPGDHRLAIIHILLPNAITAHDDELVLSGLSRNFCHIGPADDELLVVGLRFLFLVVEVPETAGEV